MTLCALGAETSPWETLRKTFEESIQKAGETSKAELDGKLDQYVKALDQSAKNLQREGDLDALLAVKKEIERCQAEKKVPDQTPANTAPVIQKSQDDYRQWARQASLDKSRRILDLLAKYQVRLEVMKKEFTVKGQFDDALAVKTESEQADKIAAVQAARFAVADSEAATPAPTVSQPGPPADGITCPLCGGTGLAKCPRCRGSGQCPSCGGQGQKPSGLKGNKGTVSCVTCKGTGQCPVCGGTGSDKAVCPRCKGAKVVPGVGRSPQAPLSPVAVPAPAAPFPVMSPADEKPVKGADSLEGYATRVASLRRLFTEGKADEFDFEEAARSADKHKGELMTSSVFLLEGHPRQVRVAGTAHDAGLGGHTLTPAALNVGQKAESLSWELKRSDRVVITYGIVSEDQMMLFDVRRE